MHDYTDNYASVALTLQSQNLIVLHFQNNVKLPEYSVNAYYRGWKNALKSFGKAQKSTIERLLLPHPQKPKADKQ